MTSLWRHLSSARQQHLIHASRVETLVNCLRLFSLDRGQSACWIFICAAAHMATGLTDKRALAWPRWKLTHTALILALYSHASRRYYGRHPAKSSWLPSQWWMMWSDCAPLSSRALQTKTDKCCS